MIRHDKIFGDKPKSHYICICSQTDLAFQKMKEVYRKIKSDYHRYTGKGNSPFYKIVLYLMFKGNHCFNYSFWLRLSHEKNWLWPLAVLMHKRLSVKYCMQIPRQCRIGYGLYIGHGICMVIHPRTVIGNNVNLSQFLNIGSNNSTPAVIGDNVWIGPKVCLVENVHIGDNSTIAAGAVVVRNVPEGTTVAGVPAKVISSKPQDFILNKYKI